MSYLNISKILCGILILCAAACSTARAKRVAPPPVAPLRIGGREIRAPQDPQKPGLVEIWKISPEVKIGEKEIYKSTIIPFLERDVQWVFVTGIFLFEGKVIVVNERDKWFKLDPAT